MNKQLAKYIVAVSFVVAVTVFIFSNSFVSYSTSRHTSDAVSEIILPKEYATDEAVSLIVRKMAHLVEFAALGFAVMLLVICIESDRQKKLHAAALFYVLLVAVIDEHIQSFSDRTSSTDDIFLDFFGALIGFFIMLAIRFVFVKLKGRKTRE